ncbi:MAG: hypothetical protein CMQ61_06430 [Gammaproteobacteria bacterium]|nr:hypothetical protein [Gammaproteobacteria bacterium]|tara:strand:+ start:899 stop:1804 length:906 start_codon:yes stop_codon:yes gene_type:complete
MSPVGGVVVTGVDIRQAAEDQIREQLNTALTTHGVLLFRDQPLTASELAAFGKVFGPIQPHVQRKYQHPEVPEVVVMTNRKPDGSFDEAGARRGAMESLSEGWHSDLSYDPVPAKATLLHATDIPSSGGNTCFSNVNRAYEELDASLKLELNGLFAEFPYSGHKRNAKAAIAASTLQQADVGAVNPVINAHAVSGKPGIYVNPLLTSHIVGVSAERSEELLRALFAAMNKPRYQWEHEWRLGDTLIWDNRGGLMHCGRLDYPRDEARRFIRTTVSGSSLTPYHYQQASLSTSVVNMGTDKQ